MPGRYEAVIIVLDKSTAEIAISPAEDDIGYWKEYPLVHVQPHGRLGDLDELKTKIKKEDSGYELNSFGDGMFTAFRSVYQCIDNAPTIIPAEKADENE